MPLSQGAGSPLTISKVLLLVQAPAEWELSGTCDGLAAVAEQRLVELRKAAQAAYVDLITCLVGPQVSHVQQMLAYCSAQFLWQVWLTSCTHSAEL